MDTALAMVLAVAVSTGSHLVAAQDGSWSASLPAGWTTMAPAKPDSLHFERPGGLLTLRRGGESTTLGLDALVYDELKDIETRYASLSRECTFSPLRTLSLPGGRVARAANARCGNDDLEFAVYVSSLAGRLFVAKGEGASAPAAELLASVVVTSVESSFPVLVKDPPPLAPLPPRAHRTQYRLLLLACLASLAAAVFLIRALPGLLARFFPAPPRAATAPGAPFPISARRLYGGLQLRFTVEFETGERFLAASERLPSVLIELGSALLVIFFLAALTGASAPLRACALISSMLLLCAGNIFMRSKPRRLSLFDANDYAVIEVVEVPSSSSNPAGAIIREGSSTGLTARRRFLDGRRLWEIIDPAGTAVLSFAEDGAAKARARRALGHLWGMLRTEWTLEAGGRVVGALKRRWSVRNAFSVDMAQAPALDARALVATLLFIERVDPDRWHPWPG